MRAFDARVDHRPRTLQEKLAELRENAIAACSELRAWERKQEFPPEHQCVDCLVGRLERGGSA